MFYIADALQKKTSCNRNTWEYIKVRSCYTFPFALIASGFITGFSDFPDWQTISKLAGASVVCALGLYFYIKAVNHIQFSNVGSLSIVGNVFQWLIGWLIFSEKISWLDLPAMILMFSGCLIQLFNAKLSKGAFYVLACSFFWVTGYSLLSNYLQDTNVFWSIPIMEGTILIVGLISARLEKKVCQHKHIQEYAFTFYSDLFLCLSMVVRYSIISRIKPFLYLPSVCFNFH
jgi:drug/metabolite transporter (DMT)-like permease